jgi:hypothetical protein
MVETDLITAIYERLAGEDAHGQALQHDGNQVPVFTGAGPADGEAPYVVISRPRTRGGQTLDGVETPEVRVQLRTHTRFPAGKANQFKCYQIAGQAHDLLEAAPLPVQGREPYVPQPDKTPIPAYDVGDRQAVDLSLEYTFLSP